MQQEFTYWFLMLKEAIALIDGVKVNRLYKEEDVEIVLFEYKGVHAELHMTNETFLCLSLYPYSKELYDKIQELFDECFGLSPCLSYNETCEDNTVLHCFEWVSYDQDSHVLRFMNAYNKGIVKNTCNVRILTGKKEEYYIDRLDKMPGIYQGDLTDEEREFYKTCSEYNLYSELKRRTLRLNMMREEEKDPEDEVDDVSNYSYEEDEYRFSIEYLLAQTSRFGTGIKPSDNYDEIQLDMDYLIWLNSWDRYVTEALSLEQLQTLEELAQSMIDVYPYLTTINSNMYEEGVKHIFIDRRYFEM